MIMQPDRKPDARPAILLAVVALASLLAALAPPLSQWPSYHDFADQRRILGIPNCLDVVSNVALLGIGILGLVRIRVVRTNPLLLPTVVVFFASITLIAAGSAYYHLAPSNGTLVWDRIPMAAAFMAFLGLVIGDFISARAGARLLLPLVILGLVSVGYWHITELQGRGDLRPYALVQFLPFVLVPLMMWLYGARLADNRQLLGLLGCLLLARAFELLDAPVYEITGIISGHTRNPVTAR
jgi:hypothetical protein